MRRTIAATALLALTACTPDSGTIVTKDYSPPWTQSELETLAIQNGRNEK